MGIKEIAEKVKELKVLAETKVEEWSPTAAFKRGEQQRAMRELEHVYLSFKKEAIDYTVFVVATGPGSKDLADLFSKEHDAYSYDAKEMFNNMADLMNNDTYIGRSFGSSHLESVTSLTHVQAQDLGIADFPTILWRDTMSGTISSREDVVSSIQKIHTDQVGLEFSGIFFLDQAAKKAIMDDFQGKVLPVVLYTEDQEYAKALAKDLIRLTNNVFLVETGVDKSSFAKYSLQEIDSKSLKNVVNKIKKETKLKGE